MDLPLLILNLLFTGAAMVLSGEDKVRKKNAAS